MTRTAQSADGVIHEFPDETPQDAIDAAMQRYAQEGQQQEQPRTRSEEVAKRMGIYNDPRGAALTIGSAAVGEVVGGITGLLATAGGGLAGLYPGGETPREKASRWGDKTLGAVRDFITIDPVNEASQRVVEKVGEYGEKALRGARYPAGAALGALDAVGARSPEDAGYEFSERVGGTIDEGIGRQLAEGAYDLTGSPEIAAVAEAVPTGIASAAGFQYARNLSRRPDPQPDPIQPPLTGNTQPQVSVGNPQAGAPVDVTPPPGRLDQATRIARDVRGKKDKRVAEAVEPDADILAAADDLGIDLNPEHYSSNVAFQDVARSLKSRPGSKLEANERMALERLSESADDLVRDMGGSLDAGVVSDEILTGTRTTIARLEKAADAAYGKVSAAIPKATRVKPDGIRAYLEGKIKDFGGNESLLSTAEKQLLSLVRRKVKGGKYEWASPTYAALDRTRRNVGNGFNKNRGPFKDDDAGVLKQVYGVLSESQNGVAEAFGVGEIYASARGLVVKRKGLEDQAVQLFGRDISNSLAPKMRSAATSLVAGDVSKLNKLMNALPESARPRVAATMLNNLFAGGSRSGGGLGQGFVNTFKALDRNASAKNAIFKYLPDEARARFDSIGKVLSGIVQSNRKPLANPSGSAGPIIKAMEDGSAFGKIYEVGTKVAAAEGVSTTAGIPGAGTAGVVGSFLSRTRTPIVVAADDMLSSPSFARAVREAARGNTDNANRIVASSPEFQAWLKTVNPGDQARIAQTGFVAWLSAVDTDTR